MSHFGTDHLKMGACRLNSFAIRRNDKWQRLRLSRPSRASQVQGFPPHVS